MNSYGWAPADIKKWMVSKGTCNAMCGRIFVVAYHDSEWHCDTCSGIAKHLLADALVAQDGQSAARGNDGG